MRLPGDRLLVTPASVSKGFMSPEMMVITDMDGRLLEGAPGRKASSELLMHLVAYRVRSDVHAVVHAHPPLATGFAVAGIPLDRAVLAEVVTTLGAIPIAEYGTPSTPELPAAVEPYVKTHDGLLLANHGALALVADLFAAYYKMETIEHFSKISLVARLLGRDHLLSREEVGRLQQLRDRYGIASRRSSPSAVPTPSSLTWRRPRSASTGCRRAPCSTAWRSPRRRPGRSSWCCSSSVSTLAAWNRPEGLSPEWAGLLGALVTTCVTFLPSFLFVLVGAPHVERLRRRAGLSAGLAGITAAVVGVILHLGVVFGRGALFPAARGGGFDPFAAALAGLTLIATLRWRLPVPLAVLAGAAAGLARFLA